MSSKKTKCDSIPHWKTRLYRIWGAMKTRCNNPNSPSYKNYGGRGIRVCEEWQRFFPFRDWAVENGYDDSLTIERNDVNGDYCPDNCRWATMLEQGNNKRNNRYLEIDGVVRTCREWDRELGFRVGVLSDRLNTLGWNLERAVTEDVNTSKAQLFSFRGETHTVSEWSGILGISVTSLWRRIRNPMMSNEEVFEKPKHGETNPLTFNGETKPLIIWARELGIPIDTLCYRIKKAGWSVEKALTTPVRHYNRKNYEGGSNPAFSNY